jgi:transcriptional regulator with XRE-family HTH domain
MDRPAFGALLRDWRVRRRFSQLALATEADVSQRHLSFLESGRAAPSREMALRLARHLALPLRERNALLAAAGFAPVFAERPADHPDLVPARAAVAAILRGHEPHPALAVDRHWTMLDANRAVAPLLAGVAPDLLAPPVNVLRLALHPQGMAPRILNFRDWRAHLLERLARQVDLSADPVLTDLARELAAYPTPPGARRPPSRAAPSSVAVMLELAHPGGALTFLSTTTVFGTPLDAALEDLAVETFFPADDATAAAMRGLLAPGQTG